MNLKDHELNRNYLRYVVPSIVAQVVFTIYTMVDGLMVGRGVSANALAGVNIASPYVTILWAISITFAVGTSTIVARLMGEGRAESADQVFTQTFITMLAISVLFGVGTYFGAEPIASFLGASENTRGYVVTYIRTIAPFAVFFITAYLFEITMPIDGHPRMATFTVVVGVAANCILDYLFIFVWGKGVWGAAFATALSQIITTTIYLIHFLGPRANIRFVKFKFDPRLIGMEFYRGLPSGAMEVSPGLATWIFVQVIGRFIGERGLIAYSTMGYVAAVMIIVAIGIGQGCQPLLSYYNGAGRVDMIRRIFKRELRDVAVISVLMFAGVFACADRIVALFIPNESAEMLQYTAFAFRLFTSFCLIDVYNVILSLYSTALEKPIPGVLVALLRCSVFLVAGIFVMYSLLGSNGIWLGMTASECITLVMSVSIFIRHKGFLPKRD